MHYVLFNCKCRGVECWQLDANSSSQYVHIVTNFALSLKGTADNNHNQFTKKTIHCFSLHMHVTVIVCLVFRYFKPTCDMYCNDMQVYILEICVSHRSIKLSIGEKNVCAMTLLTHVCATIYWIRKSKMAFLKRWGRIWVWFF